MKQTFSVPLPNDFFWGSSLQISPDGILYFVATTSTGQLSVGALNTTSLTFSGMSIFDQISIPANGSFFSEKAHLDGSNYFIPVVFEDPPSSTTSCGDPLPGLGPAHVCRISGQFLQVDTTTLKLKNTVTVFSDIPVPCGMVYAHDFIVEYVPNSLFSAPSLGNVAVVATGQTLTILSLPSLQVIQQVSLSLSPHDSCMASGVGFFPFGDVSTASLIPLKNESVLINLLVNCCPWTDGTSYHLGFVLNPLGQVFAYGNNTLAATTPFTVTTNPNVGRNLYIGIPQGLLMLVTTNHYLSYELDLFSVVNSAPLDQGLLSPNLFPSVFVSNPLSDFVYLVGTNLGTNGGIIQRYLWKCPQGTSISFPLLYGCTLCQHGFYSVDPLNLNYQFSACLPCPPDSEYCPPGSSSPFIPLPVSSIRIPQITTPKVNSIRADTPLIISLASFFGLSLAVVVLLLWVSGFMPCFGKVKEQIKVLDCYTLDHATDFNRSPIKHQTTFGGAIGALVVIGIICVLVWNITSFFVSNRIASTQVLNEQTNQLISGTLTIDFSIYGLNPDACPYLSTEPVPTSPITTAPLFPQSNNNNNSGGQPVGCKVHWTKSDFVLDESYSIYFKFADIRSYAAYVDFNATMVGQYNGIQGTQFDLVTGATIIPPLNTVLVGSTASSVSIQVRRYETVTSAGDVTSQVQPSQLLVNPGSSSDMFSLDGSPGFSINFVLTTDSTYFKTIVYNSVSLGALIATIVAQAGGVLAAGKTVLAIVEQFQETHLKARKKAPRTKTGGSSDSDRPGTTNGQSSGTEIELEAPYSAMPSEQREEQEGRDSFEANRSKGLFWGR